MALCDPSKLKKGDWASCVVYYQKKDDDSTSYMNHLGQTLRISDKIVANECRAADQFESEEKIGKKRLRDIMLHESGNAVFTVKFTKQKQVKDLEEQIDEVADGWYKFTKKRRRTEAKKLKLGDERPMTCYMKSHKEDLGRLQVIDLNAEGEHKDRQVDLRTVTELIINNKKYIVN